MGMAARGMKPFKATLKRDVRYQDFKGNHHTVRAGAEVLIAHLPPGTTYTLESGLTQVQRGSRFKLLLDDGAATDILPDEYVEVF